jgi:transcriptional regulator GlxA family with amidase domain
MKSSPYRIGLLLLPRFPLMALAGVTDLLAQAGDIAGAPGYELKLLSVGGAAVASASEVTVTAGQAIDPLPELDSLLVFCDTPLPQQGHDAVLRMLQHCAAGGAVIGGIGTGSWLLARAGLLDGYRATIHWPYASLLAEQFPATVVSSNLFEIDRNRMTAAGGSAAFDMLLYWLGERHGEELVAELTDHFGIERPRGARESQRVPLAARIGGGQPKLTEAVSLMEANFEEPLPTEEIARLVGVSRRQLERLFKQYLNSLPSRYYLELRLTRARQLLTQTSQSILQIGLSCGFSSGPHFSSAYRNHFGITPREQRSQRAGGVAVPAGGPSP